MVDVAHCREGYVNAAGLLAHLENVGSLLEEAFGECRQGIIRSALGGRYCGSNTSAAAGRLVNTWVSAI